MAKYIVNAPNGQYVTVSYAYGSKRFTHGEEVYNDKLALLFPNLFIQVDETMFEEKVIEPIMDAKEAIIEKKAELMHQLEEKIDEVALDTLDMVDTMVTTVEEKIEEIKEKINPVTKPAPKPKAKPISKKKVIKKKD